MSINGIERDFREKVCAELRLHSEGVDRYRVFNPFRFEDGDHLVVVLRKQENQWALSDEGHTYMHLTYDTDGPDLQRGTRQRIITNALSVFGVDDQGGELRIIIRNDQYGDALYSFVQALLKITDVTFLSRERVRSTFAEDFRALIVETVPEDRRAFDWHDPQNDPEGKYTVSCRVNEQRRQLFIYALQNDGQARDATISLLQFERWGIAFQSVALFENQEEINRKVLARFSDVCDKQYSSLGINRQRIIQYLQESTGVRRGS